MHPTLTIVPYSNSKDFAIASTCLFSHTAKGIYFSKIFKHFYRKVTGTGTEYVYFVNYGATHVVNNRKNCVDYIMKRQGCKKSDIVIIEQEYASSFAASLRQLYDAAGYDTVTVVNQLHNTSEDINISRNVLALSDMLSNRSTIRLSKHHHYANSDTCRQVVVPGTANSDGELLRMTDRRKLKLIAEKAAILKRIEQINEELSKLE